MEKNSPTINFTPKELKDIKTFCDLNGLDIDQFVKECFNKGYQIEKYGLLTNDGKQIIIEEKEVIKEIIKEVPVEVIKEIEVEKIVEIIKEVEVEKIVEKELDNKEKQQVLQKTISNLREEIREKDEKILQLEKSLVSLKNMEVPTKGQFMRSSNIEDNLYK